MKISRFLIIGLILVAGTVPINGLNGVYKEATGELQEMVMDPDSSGAISWNTFRGIFKMSLTLDPPAGTWDIIKQGNQQLPVNEYKSGAYLLKLSEQEIGKLTGIIRFEISRNDGLPFRTLGSQIECRTSYSGVYKIFNPDMICQQNYQIDLPFRIKGSSRAELNQPVIWMQQTDGKNTLTLGLLDQISFTTFEGSTYDTGNGGEAPGIANSYVRAGFTRTWPDQTPAKVFIDALYINANPGITWFEALEGYSQAVDEKRKFEPHPVTDWALNPMWHSWYAHSDRINEVQIREDARNALKLGATTIELDAGWNMPWEAPYSFDNEGDYFFDEGRFPDSKGMIKTIHASGQRVILHVAPLIMGKNSKAWNQMKDCLIKVHGVPDAHLDPRLRKVHDYLLEAWQRLFTVYDADGLWYDFLEIPETADPPEPGMEVVSTDLHAAYTLLMQNLFDKSISLNPKAVIILRRPSANLNAKTYCTHIWPMDTPQDYNMNRRDVVYLKTFGPGVLTHACCTSWPVSESDVNVARHMASIVMAGVPAFSVKLAESPVAHNAIIKAWLSFYEANKHDLVCGRMIPLLPTPPSAAIRTEGSRQAFFGFFEAVPGLVQVTKPVDKITLINALCQRTVTRIEGLEGEWKVQVFDQVWQPVYKTTIKTDPQGGLNINLAGPSDCHAIVLSKQ